ncbi:cucumber peeling cupredoxin-like [Benincasa hispida]|uniref:cucumber peeling cupredoxin-like n=1 Tax=Benincasa hispida TaxID=102211 RepID=UPI001900D7DC|nr:cucumber peeling cupredoxin-like [Benincasa hispida]
MGRGVGLVLGLIAVVFVHHATGETVHVVGNSDGWTVPQGGAAFYSDWAARNNFFIRDSLTFNFETNMHDVLKVTKESFDACNSNNAIGNVITTGPATVKLDTAGVHYFICTVGRHCFGGQKLSVTVSANTHGGAIPPSTNTSRPPAANTPISHDNACAPTPANSPSSSPPIHGGTPSAPAPSSSTVLMATLYVTLSALVMSLLF